MPVSLPLSRRRFLVMVTASGVLAACGDDDDSEPTTASTATTIATTSVATTTSTADATTSTAARAGAPFPRTVGRGFAAVTIAAKPERVVATADRDQLDVLLAMGVAPVLYGRSGDYETVAPWLDESQVAGLEASDMAGAFEPNLEAIAAARPDLIVDAWAEESVHAQLNRIAPTIEVKVDNTDSWQAAQRLAGAALGREDDAEAAIAETEAVVTAQRARLGSLGGLSVAVAFIDGDALVMIPGNEIGGRVFTELGLRVHPTPDGVSGRFALESIPDLLADADVIVSLDAGATDPAANPVFAALPAVQAGRHVTLDIDTATACYQESTLSIRWAAPRVTDALIA